MKKINIFLSVILFWGFVGTNHAQFNEFTEDVLSQNQYGTSTSYFMGNLKPERTDLSGGQPSPNYARFPMLIVFVQFDNETEEDQTNWPIGGSPTYINQLLSSTRKDNSNWWQAYNDSTESISSYYHEISRGKMHVVGKCVNIVLDSSAQHYRTYYSSFAESKINFDVYEKLKLDTSIYWPNYDLWSKGPNDSFYFQSDGYIDLLIMVHRRTWSNGPLGYYEGYTPLGDCYNNGNFMTNYTIYLTSEDTIKINGDYSSIGSGCKVLGKFGIAAKQLVIGAGTHEHGHYLFGSGHITYGKMCYGFGLDFSLSPWEIIKLGYSGKEVVNFSQSNLYYLNDFSARDTTNKVILQIPISSTPDDEFFLIANRRKLSTWDRIMFGDTAHDNPMRKINSEYGKGIYIYHIINGYSYPSWENVYYIDNECADGLFNWESDGVFAPDWNPNNATLPVHKPISVSYLNDVSNQSNGLSNRDGKSLKDYAMNNEMKWGAIGKKETILYGDGTDKIFVNDINNWTSRDWKGDRWDAWNVGYNEIFSPYSSPNTFSWNNDNTGIFVWYNSLNGDTANLKIYKTSTNTPLDSILKWTPPSRPMGIKNTYVVDDSLVNIYHPKISWNHNMEPDMVRNNGKKMYIVYRALANDMNQLPGPYYVKATIEIDTNSPAEYTDMQIIGEPSYLPSGQEYEPFPLRYRVEAVDKYNDYSVPSDFATAIGLKPEGSSIDPGNGDKLISENGLPKEYNLFQNYPNPFNPETNIQFDLPKEGMVNLKVYDILGREVKKLVNEFKQAGSYIVAFDGSRLSSGIYFYRLESGNFVQVRRMVLIK